MKLSHTFFGVLLLIGTFGIENARALPLGQEQDDDAVWAAELNPAVNVDFKAIIALSNCSGSLVRFSTSLPSDPALILTNGHCVGLGGGFLKPGQVIVNQPVSRTFRLLASNGASTLVRLNASRIIYATMTGTDMAIYETRETFENIEKQYNVVALTLSSAHPVAARKIAIASGYWKKIYSCSVDRFIHKMRESDWTWNDSIRYTQPGCDTIGGTSGSPIIDAETYEVIGVNNTGNESGEECTMNNPCEVDEEGKVTVVYKASYGQQTYWIYSCLDSNNQIQLSKAGCELPGAEPRE